MHKIWFERKLPREHAHLVEGMARPLGFAVETSSDPLAEIAEADGIVASAKVVYDGTLMDRAPALKVIARTGVGYDNISVPDATARGICVCYTPDAPTISTAEHTVALILAAAKQLKRYNRAMVAQPTADHITSYYGLELYGRRLGLVGLGRIGARVAKVAQALGMSVTAHDPFVTPARAAELDVELASTLEALLSEADVVSLHVPASPETRHMINAERLGLMKPGAYLINAARGALVDETALLHALESGRLSGAGLDVFDCEPPPADHPLLSRDDVIATPHLAGPSPAGRQRMWEGAISQALQVLRNERPVHLLNPDVWPVRRNGRI
jgi:D-3-phosphoglycerate dehydrogenase